MKIGELGAAAGVPAATVRYYERRGLLAPATRTRSGYRQYAAEDARRLRFIKHAQQLGYSLEEIQQMLELRIEDPASCSRVEATTRDKIREVRQRLAELRHLERTLQTLVDSCERHEAREPCPILAVLGEDSGQNAGAPRKRADA
jgi:Hg(II)-responsive transcriptional regulator